MNDTSLEKEAPLHAISGTQKGIVLVVNLCLHWNNKAKYMMQRNVRALISIFLFLSNNILSSNAFSSLFTSSPSLLSFNRHPRSTHKQRSTLSLKKAKEDEHEERANGNDENNKINEVQPDAFYIEEPRLLACDLLAILITSQVLGLTDAMLSSNFWNKGGFLQPVTVSSFSTMGTMIKRDSLISICWVLSAIYNRGYAYPAFVEDLSVVRSVFTIFTDYCSLLIIGALIMAASAHAPVDAFELVREAWFTVTIVGSFRFAYSRMNRF